MRWLHISDIHYNPNNAGVNTKRLIDRLPGYLAEQRIEVDHVFVTGDFRHAAHQPDYSICVVMRTTCGHLNDVPEITKGILYTVKRCDLLSQWEN